MNNKQIIAINCVRHIKNEKQKYHHNIAVAAVFDSINGCLYFTVKVPQAGVKDARRCWHVNPWNLNKANLLINTSCQTVRIDINLMDLL